MASAPPPPARRINKTGVLIVVMTVIYIALTVAVFALFGLVQKWVETL